MSQRVSGYQRLPGDAYDTPAWVTRCLFSYIHEGTEIWEPAAGSGKMVQTLRERYSVVGSDIATGENFLETYPPEWVTAIVTNPPYSQAYEFIERAIVLMHRMEGMVAMLLRTDYDHAGTRRQLFDRPPFARKIVLTKRIRWIEDSMGSPSFNHAWFIWNWRHRGEPIIAYEPKLDEDGDG